MRAMILGSMMVLAAAGCGDDSDGDDAGPPSLDGGPPAVTGCAMGAMACPTGQVCCEGVPYPAEGICQVDCPARSDRAAKTAFESVDEDEVLRRVTELPIHEWSYRAEGPAVRHMGPTAQDFHGAFELGRDDRTIHPVDAAGVSLAAIRALERRVSALERDNRALRARLGER